ncbi:hypothetical protein [Rufibacter roseus]|uniref:Uncharacterized protein n=1 Tax=Rufibacter roseus TaxID=1567108 RepID=A0ABW2DM26_9BACT|nr:hypothetical protein [Rufibacter roseus]
MLFDLQDQYDLETSGANKKDKQAEWDKKIRDELKELEEYALRGKKR